MATPEAEKAFVAEVTSPERRRLYLSQTGVAASSYGSFDWLGWELVVSKFSETGEELPLSDRWEETLLEILRYPDEYADQPLAWRWIASGQSVDLRALQPAFDASRRFQMALKTVVSRGGDQRICFNQYDDGQLRFTLETLIREEGLSAWVPKGWSASFKDLASAEEAAREAYGWFS